MNIPFSDMIKSIPGALGIRLEKELPYTVVKKVGLIEVRQYEPFVLARTKCSGEFDPAQDQNFKKLAEFIFGENTLDEKTSMTTPVFIDQTEEGWSMSFYLTPEAVKLVPKNNEIWIQEMPQKTVAVYRYSGNNDLEKMEEAKDRLLTEISSMGLIPVSDVWWAQYDQPFALPLTKRNEAFVKIESLS